MEWLELLKVRGFTHQGESPSNVIYSNRLNKSSAEQLISDFSLVWTSDFSLHLDGEHILSLPTENTIFNSTLDLCNEIIEMKIELKKSGMVDSSISNHHNIHIFSKADLLIGSISHLNFAEMEKHIFKKPYQPTYVIIYDEPQLSMPVSNGFVAIGDMSTFSVQFDEWEKRVKVIQDKIKERNDNIRWNQEISILPPDVFYFNSPTSNKVSEFLNKKAAELSVAFTALNTEFSMEEQCYISTYSGLKQTKFKLQTSNSHDKSQIDKIYDLYQWAFSEKTSDKIGLIQNIVNIHIKEESNSDLDPLLSNASEIFEMVKENYRVYIQKSVKSYLDERKQVEDFIRSTSNEISKQISGLTDIVTKNLFGLLATAITAAIGFNKPENQAYIPWVLYIYGFFSIALTIYYSTLANAKKKATFEVYEKRIEDYKKIFLEHRINKITGNSIEKQTKIFNRYLHWTVWPSIGISFTAIIFALKLDGVLAKLYPWIINSLDWIKDWFT